MWLLVKQRRPDHSKQANADDDLRFGQDWFWNEFDCCRGNTWTMCEFRDSNGNGFGDTLVDRQINLF